ncbi:MAG: formyltransferase family protein [Rhodospirillaceae bacterium]
MPRLILLTEPEFRDPLAARLAAPGVILDLAPTLAELDRLLAAGTAATRLLSVGAGFIVPPRILQALGGPAYNLHPGPPDYPGLFPSVFALYDRSVRFGITLHEMAAKVDEGPIAAVDTYDILPDWDRLALDSATFGAMLNMIERLAPALTDISRPLPRLGVPWSGAKRTRKDFDALCALPETADATEFARRLRAAGEGPDHALTLTRFGRTFRLTPETEMEIVRAGQRVKA